MATLTINVDDDVKRDAAALYESIGMNMTTAVNVFFRKSLQVGGIPFALTAPARGVRVNPSKVYVPKRDENGVPMLPADWDDPEDPVYDDLYA